MVPECQTRRLCVRVLVMVIELNFLTSKLRSAFALPVAWWRHDRPDTHMQPLRRTQRE